MCGRFELANVLLIEPGEEQASGSQVKQAGAFVSTLFISPLFLLLLLPLDIISFMFFLSRFCHFSTESFR
jgi:hypothetical protein